MDPALLRMTALCLALFLVMKVVVTVESRRSGGRPLGAWRWLAFALGWPGMRPALFLHALRRPPLQGAGGLVRMGLVRSVVGAVLVVAGRSVWRESHERLLAAPLLLVGISLVFHFGFLNVLAGCWRLLGVDADRLFRAPLAARSLADFWGRRWNIAFSEMAAVVVARPVAARLGHGAGVFAAFIFSAAAHELALSVPARGGYGLPTAYFLLQGGLVLLEKKVGWKNPGRLWTLAWLALPLPLLFHGPALEALVWPLVGIGGSHQATAP